MTNENSAQLELPAPPPGLTLPHAVPPRTDPSHHVVVAVHHLHRLAHALLGIGEPQLARRGLVFRREPFAVVPPHARAFLALERLPGSGIDRARAPAILHHEA